MFHKKIRIPKESASDVMEELGKLDDAIQFVDLNINDFEERKNFGNYIARCDDAEKKISSFEGICETYGEKFIKYNSGIQRIDRMTGIEFEEFLKVWFEKKGYRAELTPPSNDYGADLLLYKRILGKKELTVVQAKCHHSNIGIKAVQEVIGAMDYYKADKGIVVTNQHFSPNAVQLAKSRDVKLIDRSAFEKA